MTGHINSRKSSNKISNSHVQPYEDSSVSSKTRKNPTSTGAFRLLPIEVIPNPSILSKNGSGDSCEDDAFVFPSPPNLTQPVRPVKPPPLTVASETADNDVHSLPSEHHKRPTFLSTPHHGTKFCLQKTKFDHSPSLSHLSLGSDDQTPDTPPPSFKPPTPTASSGTSPLPLSEQELRDDAKKNQTNSSTSTNEHKQTNVRSYGDRSSKPMTSLAAARLSLRKRNENKTAQPKEVEPDTFPNLHKKAHASLRAAASNNKASFKGVFTTLLFEGKSLKR